MSEVHGIEKLWYSTSMFCWLLWPLSLVFLLLVKLKRWLYLTGLLKSYRFDKPVLVVGNLSVGGTGKTPFISRLVDYLSKRDIKVGVVSRGYRAKCKQFPHQVTIEDTAEFVGDEAYMQYRKLKVPIVIAPSRSEAVRMLIKNNNIDLVISDDGLQHYQMARDIEVVMFDANRKFGNQLILPFGPLREAVSRLNSIDYVIQNGPGENNYSNNSARIESVSFVNLKTGDEVSVLEFSKKNINAVAGIGNPQRFFTSLDSLSNIDSRRVFEDHHIFLESEFEHFDDKDIVVMTEKDAAKCYPFAKENWFYLKVEMILNDDLLENIKNLIDSKILEYQH